MFHHFRRAALAITQWLFPATGHHRQREPVRRPLTRTAHTTVALRPNGTGLPPAIRAEDIPLVRPYVLSVEEWAGRRSLAGAVSATS